MIVVYTIHRYPIYVYTVYTCVLVDHVYKLTPLFVCHFKVFKVYHNLANQLFPSHVFPCFER